MIPSSYEYLLVLCLGALTGYLLFGAAIKTQLEKPYFWIAFALFAGLSAAVDIIGLRKGWWAFSADKIVGITLVGVPLEEFLLFFLVFSITTASWEYFGHDLE